MSSFIENVANTLVDSNKAENKDYITGEKDLVLTQEALFLKMIKYEHGKSYINILVAEYDILDGQQAIKGFSFKDRLHFKIPDWDRFMSKVNAFHVAVGPY